MFHYKGVDEPEFGFGLFIFEVDRVVGVAIFFLLAPSGFGLEFQFGVFQAPPEAFFLFPGGPLHLQKFMSGKGKNQLI